MKKTYKKTQKQKKCFQNMIKMKQEMEMDKIINIFNINNINIIENFLFFEYILFLFDYLIMKRREREKSKK